MQWLMACSQNDHYKSDSNRALDAEATSQELGTEGEN